jgi:hypothetical protein
VRGVGKNSFVIVEIAPRLFDFGTQKPTTTTAEFGG